jgi:cation diffusion facilitator family transporter
VEERANSGIGRVFKIGLIVNTLLAILKLVAGLAAGSVALVADGWHSMSDVGTNAGAWVAWHLARRPADDDHHFGHGSLESMAGVIIGAVLMVGGVGIAWGSVAADVELVPGAASTTALVVAVVSILGNLGLVSVTYFAGRKARSHSMLALARDNASDALASVLVVIGILASRAGFPWVEPGAAVVIGLLVTFMGWRSVRDGFDVLTDRVRDPSIREDLWAVARDVPGVEGIQAIRIHPLGANHRVDIELSVDGDLSVSEGHDIAHRVQDAVTEADARVEGVQVHVNPVGATCGHGE